MSDNPLTKLIDVSLSEYDFGVLEHGFVRHGRDYRFLIQDSLCNDPGTYELLFTHVVDLRYETRVGDKIWPLSWTDELTDYRNWIASGEPEGYVFGTEWSLAYPGISVSTASAEAQDWSSRLKHPMHSATVETDLFSVTLVFSDVRHQKISDEIDIVRKVLIPLSSSAARVQ